MPNAWALHNSAKQIQIERRFTKLKVPFDHPGFCDHPAFLETEARNPRLLELYAHFIETKSYTQEYLAGARHKIQIAAESLRVAIEKDGRLGACVDACGILSRILDRLGVYNYIAKTSMTANFPESSGLPTSYFFPFDNRPMTAAHAVVVAPPFCVVDITARYQPYYANQAEYMPDKLLLDEFHPAEWSIGDIMAPEIILELRRSGVDPDAFLKRHHGNVHEVAQALPARQTGHVTAKAHLKYVIVAVGGLIEPLEQMTGYTPCGRMPAEILAQDIMPQLDPVTY